MEITQRLTPAMKQYVAVKEQYPDCIVMFRMGDFYEMFFEDAKTASRVLDITLTKRGRGETETPLAGLPYHSVDQYISRFIKQGYKVVIVEQVEDPKKAKGVVKRDVVRVITPGTVHEDNLLTQENNNFLISITPLKKGFSFAAADVSTGAFLTTVLSSQEDLLNEIVKYHPSEIILPVSSDDKAFVGQIRTLGYFLTFHDDRFFWQQTATKKLKDLFGVTNLSCFGLHEEHAVNVAAGGLISYLEKTQRRAITTFQRLSYYEPTQFMNLDRTTIRNLEILTNISDHSKRGTLLGVLDKTKTPMGTRLLKQWIVQPLLTKEEINHRLDDVSVFYSDMLYREEARTLLQSIYDIERLISKVDSLSINPKDLIALKDSLESIRAVQDLTKSALGEQELAERSVFKRLEHAQISDHTIDQIEKAISDDPPVILSQGGVIREGFNSSLDELRYVSRNAKQWIAEMEAQEREKTGIKSLKIRYNKIFGYFIEVTKSNVAKVPDHYIRRQTQVNAERYVTDELKEKENMILNADDKIKALEQEIFTALIQDITEDIFDLQKIAGIVAAFDVLSTFAYISYTNNYTRPEIDESFTFSLQESRHPVVEESVSEYVPNRIEFDDDEFIFVITGPNMSGKSTIMRQVALITLLAQIGCYVPAKQARIGIVDRIFTRIGASDNLFMGKSTFSVEMAETANILHNATRRSLVILDEVGRGTSTYDGLSIAWAVVEYIHDVIGAKTLFATHYHQLNRLEEWYNGIVNYNIAVKETDDGIRFLHRLNRGGTDKSYGIHVARLSGVPADIIERSKAIMTQFEVNDEVGERIHKKLRNEENIYSTVNKKKVDKDERLEKQKTLESVFPSD